MQSAKLPIGIQSFEKLRTGGYVYIDKTPFIARMASQGGAFFLSRLVHRLLRLHPPGQLSQQHYFAL
ncbi:MAG: AAA family ATPase [Rectinemataceae bacterium]